MCIIYVNSYHRKDDVCGRGPGFVLPSEGSGQNLSVWDGTETKGQTFSN